ncbi:class I SAM-dependent methyltransferase [Candidatus Parcubacteria bacterium]|nr:class I SAM-dependent methyltransferase [Candidatus Parcubacteria bacterium]
MADGYDEERFTTTGGKMFDTFEKNVVISNLPKNREGVKVLDAGAGSGRFTIEMAKRGFDVVSCDYSSAMLDAIKSKIKALGFENRVTLSKQDVPNLTFNDDEFDFICCMRVFVNLDTIENEVNALKELIIVCKPGGTVVFDIVNPKSLAVFGQRKSSMITLEKAKDIILSFPEVEIKKCFGRRILSQTTFEKAPPFLLGLIDRFDHVLSKIFPFFCVRIYFVLIKLRS